MTELSLDPIETPLAATQSSLSEQIALIATQRGSFQDLTEDALKSEIQDGVASTSSEEPSRDAQQEFDERRLELSAKIRSALNESALSLDFVSLLVSAVRPQAGTSSMSPMLQNQVQAGMLGGDTIAQSNVAPSLVEQKGDPGPGWKLIALDEAASALDAAASRLERETQREATFWHQVEATLASGERISKQKKRLWANYGYRDSGSRYFGSGLGKVERGDDGSLNFEPSEPVSHKAVVVTIHKNDQVHSRAWMPVEGPSSGEAGTPSSGSPSAPSPSAPIATARHYLFEDELFYYLLAEAREISGRVTLNDGAIVCQMYDYTIEIAQEVVGAEAPEAHGLAATICNALHLLLAERHKQNLEQSQHPEPVSSAPRPATKQTPLLAPVLAQIQQATAETRLKKLVEMMFPGCQVEREPSPSEGPSGTSPASAIDMLLTCPPLVLQVHDPEVRLRIDLPVFEAESGGQKCAFYDFSELELWLRGLS